MSTMTRSYGPHMPEHRHLLFTSVEPQSGTSEHRGGKLRSKITKQHLVTLNTPRLTWRRCRPCRCAAAGSWPRWSRAAWCPPARRSR